MKARPEVSGQSRASAHRAADVLQFWRDAGPQAWFRKDAAFDTRFRERFAAAHQAAAARQLDHWCDAAEGALALLILLDQYPRNAFRGTGHMYATDPLARHFARRLVAAGFDAEVDPDMRLFCYLPFSHSEDLADQERAVELNRRIGSPAIDHARGHRDIVQRFGHFPHRNRLLGRETTPKEQAFLDDGGFAG